MIQNHRPRGSAWNCPSLFQQSKQIRHINYEESAAYALRDEIVDSDPDNHFSPSTRAFKKRRIEKLAHDFLNGATPHIHSAQLNPKAAKVAFCSHFIRPQDGRLALELASLDLRHSCVRDEDDSEDEDDADVLQTFIDAQKLAGFGCSADPEETAEGVVVIESQASCRAKRRPRSARVDFGPSKDALSKATELRTRLRRSVTDVSTVDPEPQSCPRPSISETLTQQSFDPAEEETLSDFGPSPTPAWTSSKWIKSGAFQLRRKAVDEDCSRDELGASSSFNSSRRSRHMTQPLARHCTASKSGCDSMPTSMTSAASFASNKASKTGGDRATEEVVEVADKGKAALQTSAEQNSPVLPVADYQSQSDSQAHLLQCQGIVAVQLKSWATMNEVHEHTQLSPMLREMEKRNGTETAGKNARESKRGRTTKSAGAASKQPAKRTSTRRTTAPSTEAQGAATEMDKFPAKQRRPIRAFQAEYTAVNIQGTSPFMFRKKASEFDNPSDLASEPVPIPGRPHSRNTRICTEFPSSENPQVMARAVASPRTPLVDKHLNSFLPVDNASSRCPSSVKKALREELQASGAEFSRVPRQASSSQEDDRAEESSTSLDIGNSNIENEPTPSKEPTFESQPPQAWIGTQAMLAQAQKDLFTSPDKADTALYLRDKYTPLATGTARSRMPLQQLSQEATPMPSTQALFNDWGGWSSMKKPRFPGKGSSPVPSPGLSKGVSMAAASNPEKNHEIANRRQSGLRFSMTVSNSPAKEDSNDIPSTEVIPSGTSRADSNNTREIESPTQPDADEAEPSALSFGFTSINLPQVPSQPIESQNIIAGLIVAIDEGEIRTTELMTSFQYGQRSNDDSDSQNIDAVVEFAEDILGSAKRDLGSFLSEAGFCNF